MISNQDIINFLVLKYEMSQEDADSFMVELYAIIEQGLANDGIVKIKDFGTFKLIDIKERESVDVNSKKKIIIPAHKRITFLPAETLKKLVNKPFAHFKTTLLNEGVLLEGLSHNEPEKQVAQNKGLNNNKTSEDSSINKETFTISNETLADNHKMSLVNERKETEPKAPSSEFNSTPDSEKCLNNRTFDKNEGSTNYKLNHNPTQGVQHENMRTSERKKKNAPFIFLFLLIFCGIGLAAYLFFIAHTPKESINTNEKIIMPLDAPIHDSEKRTDSINVTQKGNNASLKETTKPRKKIKIASGKTLRLIALDEFGSREFWVYIYLMNKDIIKNPNVVPVGLELTLPYPDEFPMNANNPEDVFKAKERGDQIM